MVKDGEVRNANNRMYRILSMSWHQCSIWGCSSRKGRCPEDVDGNRRCNCRELHVTCCPESKALLTLHNIRKMPPEIHRIVVAQLKKTRKGPGGKLWKYVCNSPYVGFQGPSKGCLNMIPTLFRWCSNLYTSPAKRERRRLQHSPSPYFFIFLVSTLHSWSSPFSTPLLFLSIRKSSRMHDWLLPTRVDIHVGSNQCVFWKGIVSTALIKDTY